MTDYRWLIYALISAVCASLVAIFGKVGLFWIGASCVAGAVSWLFYFKAIQIGSVSKIAPIDKLSMPLAVFLAVVILNEKYSKLNWLGLGLIVIGAFLAALN